MSHLVEHSMVNKLDDKLNEAITSVGGDTSSAITLADYPRIIRDQLTAAEGGVDKKLIAGEGVKINYNNSQYTISADGTSNAKLVNDIKISDTKKIDKGETIQDVLSYLFSTVLANINNNIVNNHKEINDINEELIKIKDSLANLNLDMQITRTDINCYDKYTFNGVTYAHKLNEKFTYYIRIISNDPLNPQYICLWDLNNIYGGVDTADDHGNIIYNIDGIQYTQTELQPNEYYLILYVGTDTIPAFININNIAKGSGVIEDNSVTIEKLDTETRNTINSVPTIEKNVTVVQNDVTTIKNDMTEVQNDINNELTSEEAETMVNNIFNEIN